MAVVDSDPALVEKIKGGDERAFEELMGRYEGRVYRLAMGLMKNREDALEAVQDTFLTLHRKIDTFRGEASFSTWLYRIALNSAYMKLRSRGRREKMEAFDSLEDLFDPTTGHIRSRVADWSEKAEDPALRRELATILKEAVTSLPEEYRAIFTLRDVDGLSNQEVADITGLTVAATKTRLHRARVFLREKLSQYLEAKS